MVSAATASTSKLTLRSTWKLVVTGTTSVPSPSATVAVQAVSCPSRPKATLVNAPPSSSTTEAVTVAGVREAGVREAYLASLLVTRWVMVTVSSIRSASCTPVTATVCAVCQVRALKVSVAGATRAAAGSPLAGVTVTGCVGSLVSATA